MSNKYRTSSDVPTSTICARLLELAAIAASGNLPKSPEVLLSVPAQVDRDVDMVLMEAARRLKDFHEVHVIQQRAALDVEIKHLTAQIESFLISPKDFKKIVDVPNDRKIIVKFPNTYRIELGTSGNFKKELSVMPPGPPSEIWWTYYDEDCFKELEALCNEIKEKVKKWSSL